MPEEKNHYEKNHLSQVIFRVDFPTISEFNTTKLKEFQKLINTEFPILQEQKTPRINFGLGENQNFEAKGIGNLVWIFVSRDNTVKASIENNNLTLELTKYISFEELFPKIELIVNSLFKIFPETISTRLGLRYINEINLDEDNPYDWSNYINENLIRGISFFDTTTSPLSKYISLLQVKEENFDLTFKFGIPNSFFPGKIIKKEFVLDYDCYTTDTLEKENILVKVKEFNEKITSLFELSIEQGLRDEMGLKSNV